MAAPTGKGFYERQASAYPQGNSIGFAQAMGCSFIVMHADLVSPDKVRRARDAGMLIWFWSGPDSWKPESWRRTYDRQVALSGQYALQGAMGFIPDIEDLAWVQATEEQRQELYTAIRQASETFPSIGFTSYPTWPYHRRIAEAAPRVWASPQLYGIITPGSGEELRARGARWRSVFQGGYCPSLAAWTRVDFDQASYLTHFVQEEGAIFWHGQPAPRRNRLAVLEAFTLVGEERRGTVLTTTGDARLGTQLGNIHNTIAASGPAYANRRRQAIQRLTDFIVIPEVTGTGASAAAGADGRDRIAAMERAARMQGASRVSLYSSAQDTTAAVTTAMARSSGRLQQSADRSLRLPVIINALGFDFTTGTWVNRSTTNQMSASDIEAQLAAPADEPGPRGTGT